VHIAGWPAAAADVLVLPGGAVGMRAFDQFQAGSGGLKPAAPDRAQVSSDRKLGMKPF
jgi:hypothetical protein